MPTRSLVRSALVRPARVGHDDGMELFEFEEEGRMTREEAAARLHALADSLERHNEIEFVRSGIRTRVAVPDEVDVEIELEVGDSSSIEIEISW